MKLNELQPAEGAVQNNKRVGRGQGSGRGGTSTRGHKGAQSRSGYSKKKGFEGGQMPLQRRIPKFGFKNINRVEYKGLNLDTLQTVAEQYKVTEISAQVLNAHGLLPKNALLKILGRGELKTALTVKANAFSQKAIEAIEAAGGKAEKI